MIIEMKVILGGIFLGSAAGMMLLIQGRILGCSGILFGAWDFTAHRPNRDKFLFLAGLFLAGLLFNLTGNVVDPTAIFKTSYWFMFLGGIFVGGGTFLGRGCTSGHGLCGLSLLRKRSMIAVGIFFPVAIITAWLIH
ncbi:YeeE/YedE family protein [Legionella cincinnatiensis]|uniref:Transmembrane protein n=1 Tax=Legionella cincinnatiensis TaxID=28085 RepID=A0A378IMY3_9GAMM|nr:hypothetical protein [Legionella cincinnatiensis]KTC83850.1 transmembrane protein [Legionella cincinnatiensis]STX36142.1 transmembrane protein [Legionella cincinnatiensis]